MAAEPSDETITLELETTDGDAGNPREARVYLGTPVSFLKESGEPSLTPACPSYAALSREIGRLCSELDTLKQRGQTWFGVAAEPLPSERSPAVQDATPPVVDGAASLRVSDAMTRELETLDSNQRLTVAEDLMQQRRIRHLPVLNDDGDLVGIVSQRDLFFGALAWSMGQGKLAQEKALEAFPVKQVMHTDVVTIESDEPLSEAARLMADRKIGCLPVLQAGKLVGILTEGDFVALFR